MNLNIHTKNCEITESMKNYATERLGFIGTENNTYSHLTVELIRKQSVLIKLVVLNNLGHFVVTVEAKNYYDGINSAVKKMKFKMNKASKTIKQHDCSPLAESLYLIDTINTHEAEDEQTLENNILPLYHLELSEAINQLETTPDNVLFFTSDSQSIQTLVKNELGEIKLFSTNY